MDIIEFLDTILPQQGLRCVVGIKNKNVRQHFGATNEWLTNTAHKLDNAGIETYHGCATLLDGSSRLASNVAFVRSFWLDIDCGPGKPHENWKGGTRAVMGFGAKLGLPKPLIVKSGTGIHVYFVMGEDMSPAEWLPIAQLLKMACVEMGLHADPSRTADISSILRPPGTKHRKGAPVDVVVVMKPEIGTPAAMWDALSRCVGDVLPAGPAPKVRGITLNNDLTGGQEFPPSSPDTIADKCAVIGLIRETHGNVDQPTWYGGIGVLVHTVDGEDVCHEWSDGHPSYDPAETDKKIAQALNFGPTTCAKLGEAQPALCKACPHYGKLKSPIVLGHTPLAPATSVPNTNQSITSIDHITDEMAAMAAMNGRFAVVHDYGGQSAIVTFDGDGRPRVIDPNDMKTSLANRFVRRVGADGVVKLVPLVDFWLRHPLRREYDRATYDPENTRARPGERVLNLFRGLAREPRRALWSKMRRHLWVVVCRRDRKAFRYLLMWLAHAVQRPGTAPGTVIVLKSAAEGSGKSIVGGWMHSMFGPHATMLNDPEQLLGRFNAMLVD